MNFEHYLPDSEWRIQHLREFIHNRIVAILLPGPSISELERRIKELEKYDILYSTVNYFWMLENRILSQIHKKADIVLCSAKECEVPIDKHIHYLQRKEPNIFISEMEGYHQENMDFKEFYELFNERLFYFVADRTQNNIKVPNPEYPLHFLAQASFTILASILIIGKPKAIVLFGADGGIQPNKPLYYGDWDAGPEYDTTREYRLAFDTNTFNKTYPLILGNIARTYNIPLPPIINCSEKSHYQVFSKWDYDRTFKWLKNETT